MDKDIEPCPFCGGEADCTTNDNYTAANGEVIIWCTECDVSMRNGYILNGYYYNNKKINANSVDGKLKTIARTVDQWNTRCRGDK